MNIDDHIPSPLLHDIFLDRVNIDTLSITETNIFEEHHYLLQKQQRLEYQQDWYSVIHCSNLISILPKLADAQLYKIHLTWFEDRYVLYAKPKEHTKRTSNEEIIQTLRSRFDILGIIEDL